MGKFKTLFSESARLNQATYNNYFERLTELAVSMWDWRGLPDSVDERYMEMQLYKSGSAVFFEDEVLGYLCLNMAWNGTFDVYGEPMLRRAYSGYNNYSKLLKQSDSVIIWNNYMRTNTEPSMRLYAYMLYNLDRVAMVNANAQKTPVLVEATEQQRLTMLNLYKEFDGNAPFIFGNKSINTNSLKALSTQAPFVADKVYTLKTQIWNEALTALGISNVNFMKKERMITDEVSRAMGGTLASRRSREGMRKKAAKKISKMFGLDVQVDYAGEFDGEMLSMPNSGGVQGLNGGDGE